MRDSALTMLRESMETSVLNEDLLILENVFFILRSELYLDSHCFNSAVRERYINNINKKIHEQIFRLELMLKKMNLIFKQIKRIRRNLCIY